jgi:hypothetical protein
MAQFVGMRFEKTRDLGVDGLGEQGSAPCRNTSVSTSQNSPGWAALMT